MSKVLVGDVRHGIVTRGRREEGCGGAGVSVRVTNATFVRGNFLEVGGDGKTSTGEKEGRDVEKEGGMFLFREAVGCVQSSGEEG